MISVQELVDAQLYPDRESAIQDALRSLLREKPQLRLDLAIHRYQTEDISLAKAAYLAGVSFDRMKALLVQRGVQLGLGPADEAEAQQEVAAVDWIMQQGYNGSKVKARSASNPSSTALV